MESAWRHLRPVTRDDPFTEMCTNTHRLAKSAMRGANIALGLAVVSCLTQVGLLVWRVWFA